MSRLGYFEMFLVTNCLTKVAQIFIDVMGDFEKISLFKNLKTVLDTFLKIGLLFILPSGHTCLQQQSVFEFIFAIETKLQIQIASCANIKKSIILSGKS